MSNMAHRDEEAFKNKVVKHPKNISPFLPFADLDNQKKKVNCADIQT